MSRTASSAGAASAKPKSSLVASYRIEGTPVYGREGKKIGSIHSFIINKLTGQVAYVVLSFGGFLGLGQSYHPMPWDLLSYDLEKEGYVVTVDKGRLEGSPSYRPDDAPLFDEDYAERVSNYYLAP